jgi:methionyl-tRNA formyltransferase
MKKLNVVFFGTPEFSVPTLDLLSNHPQVNISYVISMPDRPAGRGHQLKSPEVIEYAKKNKIPFFQTTNINKEDEFLSKLESEDIDIYVVLAFAQFLNKRVLDIPKIGPFNIHTSVLPKYRGAAPIQYALVNGDKETGVSIQKMVKAMDAGDLVHFDTLKINDTENGGQLYTRLKFQAALSCNNFLIKVLENKIIYTPQMGDITFAPTLKKEDGLIHFERSNYETINNKLRALDPWPGTYFFLNSKRCKVFEIIQYDTLKLAPGVIESHNSQILVGCIDSTIRLTQIQLQGKKRSSDTVFLNGYREELNITEG